ncbi:hypothetical protein N665_2899s0003 [Sinapis alba]|nr:hypothetical protein N665_2899s0003 [Sinapis alba]
MKSSCSFNLFILAAVIFFGYLNPTGAITCHPDDEAGLLAFKAGIIDGDWGSVNSWTKGTDCCSWTGVSCANHDRVTSLSLGFFSEYFSYTVSGTISPSLSKIQHLESLSLINLKEIRGPFPQFLLRLPKLKHINIESNRLSGPLPTNIGMLSPQLEKLTLSGNQFTGAMPSSISNLTRLTELYLSNNLLTGRIPPKIGNLKLMSILKLDGNRLSGPIPDFFKSMNKLRHLDLSRNRLSGKLPPSLGRSLEFLQLAQNNLSGTIPRYISRLTILDTLDLSNNRFSGAVPQNLSKLTHLTDINLSHNLLTNPFPVLKVTENLRHLDLSYNKFQMGTIPEWVTTVSFVFTVKLAKCGIKMSLNDWKPWGIRDYRYIDLSENEITGNPEHLLVNEGEMLEFQASGNKLRFDLGKLNISERLQTLDLSRNLVFGNVPEAVAGLFKLNLSRNHLCGKLPATRFPRSVFAGNDCLCGSPLPPCKG